MTQAELRGKILDFDKLVLYTDSTEQGKRARMQFGGRDGNPRITVFTGVDGRAGIIQGPMDPLAFMSFVSLMESVISQSAESKYKIDLKANIYENDKRTDKLKVLSELWFGKDEKGVVWIALAGEGSPRIKFEFMNGIYTDIYYNGLKMEARDISPRIASKYLEVLKSVFATYTVEHSMQPRITGNAPAAKGDTYEKMEDIAF